MFVRCYLHKFCKIFLVMSVTVYYFFLTKLDLHKFHARRADSLVSLIDFRGHSVPQKIEMSKKYKSPDNSFFVILVT